MHEWWESSAQIDSLLAAFEAVEPLFWLCAGLIVAIAAAAVYVECHECLSTSDSKGFRLQGDRGASVPTSKPRRFRLVRRAI
jgi:hypothetical protein